MSEEYPKIADYFVVAGLTENSKPLEEDLAFPNAKHKLSDQRKDPITDISVIDRTLEETCPQGFTCIEQTPTGLFADLNHGSLTAHNLLLCYRRGKDKPPLIDLGVFYEGLETVRPGIEILETTPAGKSANVNNKSGMGSHPIYLTYRRAKESAPQNALVVTDICIIITNKGEKAPYAFCQIPKNLNKGLIGSSVHLCYKKSMRQVDSLPFKAGFMGRYPAEDTGSFPLPATVPLFCLPMGATIECWSSKTRHPLPTFSSFVLTTETSEKVFGAVVSFYESYPEEKLTDEQRYKLGLLRGDGQRSRTVKTVHTNKAICLLSRWPMFSAFRDVLMYLYRLTVSPIAHPIPVERHIAHFMHNVPFPTSQRPRVQYQMSPMHTTILTRPQITPIPLSGASFLALLDDLGPENTITLLVLALTEHKIVIHSLRPAEITCVAEALITLLFPFKWQCTYVPLCPLEMGYVLEAPCPFIVGVDSRYFDLYEPPSDVACVNLDTNSITVMEEKLSWKVLPKKPAKYLRSVLQKYFKEVKECPREESTGAGGGSMLDPDMARQERHRQLDLAVQEAVLKMMCSVMKGYRQFLLPITEAPSVGTTDPSSLFNIQEFIRSRERASQRFFTQLSGTQLFSSFIEERSLTSFAGGEGDLAAGRSSSLVFFDECIDRLTPEHASDSFRLIEADDSLKSEHTVMIMPPDEYGLPAGVGYQYTIFPELQDELFFLGDDEAESDPRNGSMSRPRRKSDTFTFGRRTKQEVRTLHKLSRLHNGDPQLWARLLLSHTYGAWFACLPAFVQGCRHKSAALRTAHDALFALKEKECFPLPDETYYRMLLHLCAVYNKPALAVRVFQFVKKSGAQLSAITYGLYNKAVLEGTWPTSNRDGYMLWQKLRNVFLATQKFRYGLRRRSSAVGSSDVSSDFDTTSRTSLDSSTPASSTEKSSPEKQMPVERSEAVTDGHPGIGGKSKLFLADAPEEECKSTGGQSDHGYNSMPKDLIRRGSPHKYVKAEAAKNEGGIAEIGSKKDLASDEKSSGAETTGSLISLTDSGEGPNTVEHRRGVALERTMSGRIVEPPTTLDIPSINSDTVTVQQVSDPGLKSDETLVNGDGGDAFFPVLDVADSKKDGVSPHRPRSTPVSPGSHRKPGRSSSIVKSTGSASNGGGLTEAVSVACDALSVVEVAVTNGQSVDGPVLVTNHVVSVHARPTNNDDVISPSLTSPRNAKPFWRLNAPPPLLEVTPCDDASSETTESNSNRALLGAKGLSPAPLMSPSLPVDNVFNDKPDTEVVTTETADDSPVNNTEDDNKDKTPNQESLLDVIAELPSASPSTPEIANLFGGDSKFLSSLSDSDQKRYQELCCHRASSVDSEHKDCNKRTRHGSLLFQQKLSRGRSSTALYGGGGGISPLVGQKSFSEFSTYGGNSPLISPNTRNNFDNLTAEDIVSPSGSPRHVPLGARSPSGSILKTQSPSRHLATSNSPKYRRRNNQAHKMIGTNSLVVVDGVAMLTSTPMRPVAPSDQFEHYPLREQEQEDTDFDATSKSIGVSIPSAPKQKVERKDISNLDEDPLSPSYNEPSPLMLADEADEGSLRDLSSNNLSRHLVDEIEDHLQRDTVIRSASDASNLKQQQERIQQHSDENLSEEKDHSLHRKASLPSHSPNLTRKSSPAPLTRSSTLDNTSSWFSSGSKFNSLLKATTVGMATKAKKVASNLAKDLNETMQASLAYYTPEKLKDSLSDLSFRSSQEDMMRLGLDGPSSRKQLLGVKGVDQYSSQTSLRSSESIHSGLDAKPGSDKVQRRKGGRKNPRRLERPLSMPHVDIGGAGIRAPLASSYLSVPGDGSSTSPDPNITASMLSLNTKGNCDVEVIISSCSKCHKCGSLVYDEEIMAGWIADESNLNTHCPFCNSLFVPFLDIEIKDYRGAEQRALSQQHLQQTATPTSPMSERSSQASGDAPRTQTDPTDPPEDPKVASKHFTGEFALPLTPDLTQSDNDQSGVRLSKEGDGVTEKPHADPLLTPPRTPASAAEGANEEDATTPQNTGDMLPGSGVTHPLTANEDLQRSSSSLSENPPSSVHSAPSAMLAPVILDPVTVPYLSSLVLRKELESLLENEGSRVLIESAFVDHHPIIYWNLVWYFRRLNLHTNLYNLLLESQLLCAQSVVSNKTKGVVRFHLMWDNIKLHADAEKSPLYFVWHQLANQGVMENYPHYSVSFLENIRDSIMQDDVRSPLVAVIHELNAQSGIRRSAYREILYMVIVALGKESIDVAAFDREYIRAYEALSASERAQAKKCDRPPSEHAMSCRNIFGELDLSE